MTGAEVRPGYTLGVDLGTSHTVAMLRWPDGRTRPLLFDGQPLLPSAVFLDQSGRLHVGRDAYRLGQADPARLEPHPKRHIDAESVLLAGTGVPVSDLFAALLGGVAQVAVATAGFLPPAILTYPASWGSRRRAILTEALGKAGWPGDTQLVPEPVAAARYFTDVLRRPVPIGSAMGVFDFGGGTLDVAVVRNEGPGPDGQPRFAVVTSGGADDLGGLDIDSSLVDHLGVALAADEPRAWHQLIDPASLAQWRARRQFWDDVRGAKEMLSRAAQAPVPIPGVENARQITREELEHRAEALVRRAVAEAGAVLKAAGTAPADLAGLFLVGGSTRVPMVSRLLHAELGVQPTTLEQPELPVAEGAVVVALAAGAAAPRAEESPATSVSPAALGTPPPTATMAAPSASEVPLPPPPVISVPAAGAGPQYAEPVDPWATGEAAALNAANGGAFGGPSTPVTPSSMLPMTTASPTPSAGHTPSHEPWLASQQGEMHTPTPPPYAPHSAPPHHSAPPFSAAPAAPPRRSRRWVWITAAVAVVVLGVGTTLAVVFWPDYRALDFQAFQRNEPVVIAPEGEMSSGFNDADLVGDTAYFAYTRAGDGPIAVVAADAKTGAKRWESEAAGTADRWEQLVALPFGAAVFAAADPVAGERRMVVLKSDDGTVLMERLIDNQDGVLFVGDQIVLDQRSEGKLTGIDPTNGRTTWEKPNPESSSSSSMQLEFLTTTADHSGPADVAGIAFDPNLDDDTRLIQVTSDKKFRVLDAADGGREVAPLREGVAGPNDEMVGFNDRFVVVNINGSNQTLVAYDLSSGAEPTTLFTAPSGVVISKLIACGAERVCWIETTDYEDKTTRVASVNAVKGGTVWHTDAPETKTLSSVGESLLATTDATPPTVTLYDEAGKKSWSMPGVAGRLDAGNVLRFNEALSTASDNPALTGIPVGEDAVELGPLNGVRSSTCAWNTSMIACVRDRDFVVQRFAG